jgi:hypothetical protein
VNPNNERPDWIEAAEDLLHSPSDRQVDYSQHCQAWCRDRVSSTYRPVLGIYQCGRKRRAQYHEYPQRQWQFSGYISYEAAPSTLTAPAHPRQPGAETWRRASLRRTCHMAASCCSFMVRRNRPTDRLLPLRQPTWLVVRNKRGAPLEPREIAPGSRKFRGLPADPLELTRTTNIAAAAKAAGYFIQALSTLYPAFSRVPSAVRCLPEPQEL